MSEIHNNIEKCRVEFLDQLEQASSADEIQDLKVKYLGKKGKVTSLLKTLGSLPPEKRPAVGQLVNKLRDEIEEQLSIRKTFLEEKEWEEAEQKEFIDVTLPSRGRTWGAFHPVAQVTIDVINILSGLGFSVALGPEIEDDFHNFEALNIPSFHPARDMQDTFYFDEKHLLRTHTSPVQVRSMLKYGAPLRIVCPGKVYRRDSDPTHSPMFHQLEGLLVDKDIAIADLKGCLEVLVNSIFGRPLKARYRASYFPFTEPSLELDVECVECSGKNPQCRICKGTGWLEIGGLGMVHPNVLRAGGIDPNVYNGFAWGMGLDRLALLKYKLTDLRVLFEGNVPYLLSGRCKSC
ncbi:MULTISPECIES: phenylalanine--tRNA ligase subunit alpha [Aminobacterium]|uniref:Phenylalanine--tRNA ligase alpha subunit n=1 Tax=Aminobacterium colombiense (strain DSM 12261 / ALA-1) TaxID=572547 RepID=D5EE62_AMICL|nr:MULTISPECIES: phenylalanine--tRNA ligase subunit alpha [Aminobacterium]MDD2378700.1 phenylalanine--tRNA ligase subunit alpha [Aminobacterium colombiense]ADE56844.1 phenylalanyl-tRNA synthetase, alpha subunit [Aminobacterium colombiense DSM 12261]MDD3767590.1 phenylalanine--tRNA ligase subunit alpha [Aminobacterium colombiense]MDD4265001.1 phenylalanine--tRNA ligase subunit alpha [Aminobacterium colombiense]MDD4585436.1 phenylalanine--tRNA ligase subunit alpha [Aminobacterium colombiense]